MKIILAIGSDRSIGEREREREWKGSVRRAGIVQSRNVRRILVRAVNAPLPPEAKKI